MLTSAASHGAEIGLCGTCMDAGGFTDAMIVDATRRSSLDGHRLGHLGRQDDQFQTPAGDNGRPATSCTHVVLDP